MIRPHDQMDGKLADIIAHGVEIDAKEAFHQTAAAISIERDIAEHRLLDASGDRFWARLAEANRDGASYWWDAALIGDFERGAMP